MRRLPALVVAVFLAGVPSADAFQLETTNDPSCDEAPGVNCPHLGTPLEWRRFPVGFFVDPDFSGVAIGTLIDAAEAAFDSWQQASGDGITFRLGGTAAVSGASGDDGRNVIHFRPFTNGQATFAQSVITFDSETGEIFDVDIELNSNFTFAVLPAGQNDPSDPRVDLQAVLTHEAGHLLGLDHENRFGSAVVMYFSDTTGSSRHRNLTSDDRAGVLAIYASGSSGGDGDGGDDGGGGGGGCQVARAPSADRFAVIGLLPALLLLVLRRRRRAM